jgi:hypothetical protein
MSQSDFDRLETHSTAVILAVCPLVKRYSTWCDNSASKYADHPDTEVQECC